MVELVEEVDEADAFVLDERKQTTRSQCNQPIYKAPVHQEEATQLLICISSTTLSYKMKLLQSNITQPSINCCSVFSLGLLFLMRAIKQKH